MLISERPFDTEAARPRVASIVSLGVATAAIRLAPHGWVVRARIGGACGLSRRRSGGGRNSSSQQPSDGAGVAAALACDGERHPASLCACEPARVPRQPGVYGDAALGQVGGDRLGDGAAARGARGADAVGDDPQSLRVGWRAGRAVGRAGAARGAAGCPARRARVVRRRRRSALHGAEQPAAWPSARKAPTSQTVSGYSGASAFRARVSRAGLGKLDERLRVGWRRAAPPASRRVLSASAPRARACTPPPSAARMSPRTEPCVRVGSETHVEAAAKRVYLD